MRIGVLALQGAFIEHQHMLEELGVETRQVRLPQQLDGLHGLIIPGGESTTIGKLAVAYEFMDALRAFGRDKAIWGTCAGSILLSKDVRRDQPLLELMHITVERNAFGRRTDSFEIKLQVRALAPFSPQNTPFRAIFIRAPLIENVSPPAEVIASLPDGRVVAAREGRLLATAFHPELTGDDRFHRFFLELAS